MIRDRLFIALLVSLLLSTCELWGPRDNPADPKAVTYQGYETVSSPDAIAPAFPANGGTLSGTTLTAKKVAGASAYEIAIAGSAATLDSAPLYTKADYVSNVMDVSSAGLLDRTTYYWRVRAYDAAGKAGVWSPPASFATNWAAATSAPSVPANVQVVVADGTVTLGRTASLGATSYDVYYKAGTTAMTSDTKLPSSSISGTAATISGLTNGTQYAFIVTARNARGSSAASPPAIGTPVAATTAPSVPIGLVATSGDSQVSLSWTAASGASSYNLYYKAGTSAAITDTQVAASSISGTTALVTGLTNGTQYAFVLVAVNSFGSSAASAPAMGTPVAATSAPAVPLGVAATAGDGLVTVSWASVPNATSYNVYYRAGTTAATYDTKVATSSISGTTATVTGLVNGTNYAFVVTAINAVGASASSAPATATPVSSVTIPAIPTNVMATAGNAQVTVTWTAVTGATSYSVYYKAGTSAATTDTKVAAGAIVGTTATVTGLAGGTLYAFVVTAGNSAGNSAASAVATATPKPLVEMIAVSGGSFNNGTSMVILSPFRIGTYEITQSQYAAVIGTNPSQFKTYTDSVIYPVENVSWYDAVEFCNKLSLADALENVYTISARNPATGYPILSATVTADWTKSGYRLPTEAEWEFAARGGSSTKGFTYAGSNDVDTVAWYNLNSDLVYPAKFSVSRRHGT